LNLVIAMTGFFVPALIRIEENKHTNTGEMETAAAVN
jgi:hypothetical protein